MRKRVCYIHVGPHKTGTSSIQWFLQQNRAELLKHGYFVPESGAKDGAHHSVVRRLCGQQLREHEQSAAADFARALDEISSEVVVLSSEVLDGLLRQPQFATAFFSRIKGMNLEPKLILFPRNQPQTINSRYSEVVKAFCVAESFRDFALKEAVQRSIVNYSVWIALADAHSTELIAIPFTRETVARGVVPEFLRAIGVNSSSQFRSTDVRRNEAAGPFTIGVARSVLRSIADNGKPLKWLQSTRCKAKLASYLEMKGLADSGYCGLTTALARSIEAELRSDNDLFAQRFWSKPWAEVFAADVAEEFTPNDFDICRPAWFTRRRLRRAIREMSAVVYEILRDPALAVETPWNDLQQRCG